MESKHSCLHGAAAHLVRDIGVGHPNGRISNIPLEFQFGSLSEFSWRPSNGTDELDVLVPAKTATKAERGTKLSAMSLSMYGTYYAVNDVYGTANHYGSCTQVERVDQDALSVTTGLDIPKLKKVTSEDRRTQQLVHKSYKIVLHPRGHALPSWFEQTHLLDDTMVLSYSTADELVRLMHHVSTSSSGMDSTDIIDVCIVHDTSAGLSTISNHTLQACTQIRCDDMEVDLVPISFMNVWKAVHDQHARRQPECQDFCCMNYHVDQYVKPSWTVPTGAIAESE